MAGRISQFEELDNMFRVRTMSLNSNQRRICRNRKHRDAVSRLLDECPSPSTIGELAVRFGMHPDEVVRIAKSARNFGLFRMTTGNCIRGIMNRGILRYIGCYTLTGKVPLELTAADVLVGNIVGYPPLKQTP